MSDTSRAESSEQRTVAGRYELLERLGSGGMASVYRARELALGREVALKELTLHATASNRANVIAWFEREFHTLAQLKHPCVISVYDYGISERGPYYTMELLDGGDIRERMPVPWQKACALFFDVCSSLALLHSRRFVHRDITLRNIRCTLDGRAKLIDFGAMAPIGAGGIQVVGTPAFTAPETVQRLALDGRTDLFSLGATLYAALTGELAFSARSFPEATVVWGQKPLAPSYYVPDIPAALDDLVLSMLSIEPALRPASAFDVMQRLAAIANLQLDEAHAVSAAYLTTPSLIGREPALSAVREELARALHAHGGAALLHGPPGLGRSRLLDSCALEAKTLGLTVLRATASGDVAGFSVARALLEHLANALPAGSVFADHPELFIIRSVPAAEGGADMQRHSLMPLPNSLGPLVEPTQEAITRLLLDVSRGQPLMLAVDDVHRMDPTSAAVLVSLIDNAEHAPIFVLMTADEEADDSGLVMEVLERRCQQIALSPLTADQTRELLSSVFGDVEHLDNLSRELYAIARGNPGITMDLAHYLVERGRVSYSAGAWRLPSELVASDLPPSKEEALRAQLALLSPTARALAEAQALAYTTLFDREAYRELRPETSSNEVYRAVSELVRQGLLAPVGSSYKLANQLWTSLLLTQLDEESSRRHHLALAQLYAARSQPARIYHLFAAGEDELGLDELKDRHARYEKGFDLSVVQDPELWKLMTCTARAIEVAPQFGRPLREQNELRRWSLALNASTGSGLYKITARDWFAQLRHDSGLDVWQQSALTDPGQRLTEALTRAQERFVATPEPQRVYSVEEAIRRLAEYVAFCIAAGARNFDLQLLASLPPVLEPFAPLSPLLAALRDNARATMESQCESRCDDALDRWRAVLAQLDALPPEASTLHLEAIQNAVAYGVGMMEARLGIASGIEQAARLDRDPMQKLSAIELRKLIALEQGDWAAAERYRRQTELTLLQSRPMQMFQNLITIELSVYAAAKDLAGIQHAVKGIEAHASCGPIWKLHAMDAVAQFELARGDFSGACARFREGLASCEVRPNSDDLLPLAWISLQAGLAEALLGLGAADEARRSAAHANALCEARRVGSASHPIARALALAEAACGDFSSANARLDRVIEQQKARGASGLWLGLTFEARARVAIWNGDEQSFASFARMAAQEYRRGPDGPLAARHERLLEEAHRHGFDGLGVSPEGEACLRVEQALWGATDARERNQRALRLLCEACAADTGHLFLVDRTGARLAASLGASEPPPGLQELVDDYLAQLQGVTEAPTAIVDTDETSYGGARAKALGFELMPLANQAPAIERQITGVVAISGDDSRSHSAVLPELLAELASQLNQLVL